MKCFYHLDDDGKCAAFWVYLSAGIYDGYENDSEFIPINYGMAFPFEKIRPNEQVYIVDYSIMPDEMRKLLEITKDVTWIDHHKSAIERYTDFEIPIRGIRYDGVAGCMLTYCWLHHMTESDVLRYLYLVDRKLALITSEVNWKPKYTEELAGIDKELKQLRVIIDKEHEKRSES